MSGSHFGAVVNTPAARSVLAVPMSLGGFSFLLHQHEAALHYLSATLPFIGEWTGLLMMRQRTCAVT